jgi:hypothetical protein
LVRGAASEAKIGNANLLSKLTFGAVMAFAIIAALNELNVAPVVVNTLYIGLVAALALALGLAFGLGGRDTAARLTEQWADQLETTTEKVQASQTDVQRNRICAFRQRARIAADRDNTRDL